MPRWSKGSFERLSGLAQTPSAQIPSRSAKIRSLKEGPVVIKVMILTLVVPKVILVVVVLVLH